MMVYVNNKTKLKFILHLRIDLKVPYTALFVSKLFYLLVRKMNSYHRICGIVLWLLC